MPKRTQRLNPNKIVGQHPFLSDVMVDLRWYRGASRYNNGATTYGTKYQFRLFINRAKEREKDQILASTLKDAFEKYRMNNPNIYSLSV